MALSVSNDTVICRGSAEQVPLPQEEKGFDSWPSIPFGENQYVAPSLSASYPVEVTESMERPDGDHQRGGQYLQRLLHQLPDGHGDRVIATPEPPCPSCDFDWDFRDGATSEEMHHPRVRWLGDYYAQLTVTNPLGCADSAYLGGRPGPDLHPQCIHPQQ